MEEKRFYEIDEFAYKCATEKLEKTEEKIKGIARNLISAGNFTIASWAWYALIDLHEAQEELKYADLKEIDRHTDERLDMVDELEDYRDQIETLKTALKVRREDDRK